MATQLCTKCNNNLSVKMFDMLISGNYRSKCKKCRYEEIKINRQNKKENIQKNLANISKKMCSKCDKEKDVSNFNKLVYSNDGYNKICKACYKINRKTKRNIVVQVNQKKTCYKCNILKDIIHFKTTARSKDNHYNTCISCTKPRQWNKEKQKMSEKKYIEKNPDKIREKWRIQGKKINRVIRSRLNKRIWDALLKNGQRKNNKTSNYVGCNIIFLKKWFEYQFQENMSWENSNLWHIDHVTPCSKYDLTDEKEQYICFNWSNLRPCWILENLQKSDSYNSELIESQKLKCQEFLKQSTTKLV